ncbi:unnamed protein product, partial [Meganyctiphanes norvegica]
DIDLNDPEVAKAASKIQAGFRGHQVRKENKDKQPISQAQQDEDDIADIDLTDPDLADAALKIQAGFRGHLVRKKEEKTVKTDELNKKMADLNTEEELDIDLTDPELDKAATKIQATFRGHKTRKAV